MFTTKTITLTIPVPTNPVKKLRKSILSATVKYRYEKGDIVGAYIAYHQYKNV